MALKETPNQFSECTLKEENLQLDLSGSFFEKKIGDTFEKSLSEGPQKSIGNIMYENKKISLIIDKNFPDLYFFSQSDFLFGEKQ